MGGQFSLIHWMIILAVVLLLFGTGRISGVMGEFAKGIKAFRQGLHDDEPVQAARDPGQLRQEGQPAQPSPTPASTGPKVG